MMDANPGLVYLSLPGFSEADQEHRDVAAWEGVVAAAMGQFTDMGLNRVLMGIEASYSPLTLASAYAAVFGALSVVLALRARLRHGRGERIEVPLAAALMEGLAYNSLWIADLPQRYQSLREREIARRRAQGLPMNLAYEQLQTLLDPFYKSYPCRDGRRIYEGHRCSRTAPARRLRSCVTPDIRRAARSGTSTQMRSASRTRGCSNSVRLSATGRALARSRSTQASLGG